MKDNSSILVLTNSADGAHTDVVIDKLKALGENVFRFDVDRIQTGALTLRFYSGQDGFKFQFQCDNYSVLSHQIKSVWYRRPNHFALAISDLIQRRFAEEETRYVLEGIWLTMRKVFWLSWPDNIERARKKLFQLSVARQIGFLIPKTIVTNDPDEVRSFLHTCDNKVIFKTVRQEYLDYGDKGFNIPTTLIGLDHVKQLELVRRSPCLFQEMVEKAYELRITVVGKRVFAVRINSQKHETTSVDWRDPTLIGNLDYNMIELPDHINQFCLRMLDYFGLQFGTFDLAFTPERKYIFFELNPNGQWYWLENRTGACISDAIADILSKVP